MAKYKLTIEITHAVQEGDRIRIDMPIGIELFWFEFFLNNSVDNENVPVEIGNTTSSTLYNLYTAFQANYNQQLLYTVSRYGEIMEIVGDFLYEPVLGGTLPVGTNFTVELQNPDLVILSAVPQANAVDTCGFFDVLVEGNHEFTELLSPYAETFAATLTHLIINIPRGVGDTFVIEIKDFAGETARRSYPAIAYLNEGVIDLDTVNGSLIITSYANSLILEYSLNGTDWQSENVFNNLASGQYILYIRDQFLCQITMDFVILVGEDGNTIAPEPYFFVANDNCLRFAKREEWSGTGIQKNSTNTLSCEVQDEPKHTQLQYYLDGDVISLQFKNNYPDLKVVTSDDGLSQVLTQKSDNIGIKSSMDCRIADLGNNQFGVYFISGNTYDYDTGEITGTYVLNGEVPQFGQVGNIITISNANYTIEYVTYNEKLKVEQLVVSSTSLIETTNSSVKAIYNIYGYEIFETNIACLGRKKFNVQVFYGGDMEEPKYVTELVSVIENHKDLALMTWYMNYNTKMFYATGIIPSARIFVNLIKAGINNEGESYETDSDSILIDSDNYEVDIFTFEPQTKEYAKALVLWLSSQEVTIRGVGYRKEGIEMEPLERSNLYVVTATMMLRGTGTYEDRVGSSNVELLELIKTDADAFIKLK